MTEKKSISSDFPFQSKFVEILGSRIHYIDEGSGDPILFLHGNPTSSYLWRNIIPYLTPYGRCIAPDLIGMGKSDRPNMDYRFLNHFQYVNEFIEKLDLSNITFVVHDWGSAIGFHYSMGHEDTVKAIAFMEALVKPSTWQDFPSEFKLGFRLMRTRGIGWFLISGMNMFVKKILPQATFRTLTKEELQYYAEPYKTIKSRKPIRQWPCEIPIDGKPSGMHNVILSYSQKLKDSNLPKLLFYAKPGGIIDVKTLEWCKQNLKNLKRVSIGNGIHYLQEDNPHLIGEELANWYRSLLIE